MNSSEGDEDSYKLNLSFGTVALTPKSQSGLCICSSEGDDAEGVLYHLSLS
jgi:hypothetical protein